MNNANLQLIIWEHKHLYFVESLKINFSKKYFVNGNKMSVYLVFGFQISRIFGRPARYPATSVSFASLVDWQRYFFQSSHCWSGLISKTDESGRIPLHWAVSKGRLSYYIFNNEWVPIGICVNQLLTIYLYFESFFQCCCAAFVCLEPELTFLFRLHSFQ